MKKGNVSLAAKCLLKLFGKEDADPFALVGAMLISEFLLVEIFHRTQKR